MQAIWAAGDFVNRCRISPRKSSPARSCAMPCIGISRAGAGGSARLSIATSLWPAPLRCIAERSAGICCGRRPICFSRGRRSPSSSWPGRRGGPAWKGWRHGLPAAGSSWRPRSRARSSGWWQPNCSKSRVDAEIGSRIAMQSPKRYSPTRERPHSSSPRPVPIQIFAAGSPPQSRPISGRAPRRPRSQPALLPPVWVPWSSSRQPRVS